MGLTEGTKKKAKGQSRVASALAAVLAKSAGKRTNRTSGGSEAEATPTRKIISKPKSVSAKLPSRVVSSAKPTGKVTAKQGQQRNVDLPGTVRAHDSESDGDDMEEKPTLRKPIVKASSKTKTPAASTPVARKAVASSTPKQTPQRSAKQAPAASSSESDSDSSESAEEAIVAHKPATKAPVPIKATLPVKQTASVAKKRAAESDTEIDIVKKQEQLSVNRKGAAASSDESDNDSSDDSDSDDEAPEEVSTIQAREAAKENSRLKEIEETRKERLAKAQQARDLHRKKQAESRPAGPRVKRPAAQSSSDDSDSDAEQGKATGALSMDVLEAVADSGTPLRQPSLANGRRPNHKIRFDDDEDEDADKTSAAYRSSGFKRQRTATLPTNRTAGGLTVSVLGTKSLSLSQRSTVNFYKSPKIRRYAAKPTIDS
ncbi:hypothetical protein IWQ60_000236 [Tieghemiomyces parasiticus]|uniref:Uncharacterized protein n=1 Tax=Tieghemiomyces parasiticus TaxID=78921 RepID=A0A9W8AIY4_9FUNG|nr:hypothetical protein IWQ60_000236 [Tieghemiomyces parasiticus]